MGEIVLSCTYEGCMRTYVNAENLTRHIEATHSGSQQYQCQYCHKHLSSKQNLKEHTYIHTGERPYVCRESDCGASFRQGSQLSAHKRIHSAIRQYSAKINFMELKVKLIQLTSLLKNDPKLLNEYGDYSKIEPSEENFELPHVKGNGYYVPLPWFGVYTSNKDSDSI